MSKAEDQRATASADQVALYLAKHVSWATFKKTYNEFIGGEQ